uniref:Ig-like domain-containing protein n=1 Tax=Oncorhynchus kisutch TaxID=8019 RepID=A0A8C7FH52_ONCKI
MQLPLSLSLSLSPSLSLSLFLSFSDFSLPASLIVSPDRSQFFEYESVSLSCEVQGNSAGWRVVRNTLRGYLSECNTDWGKQQGSSCIVYLIPSDSGVYWCESGSGEHSNAVKITVHAFLSVSPDRSQFFKYESVSLSCEVQGNSAGWILKRYTVSGERSDCGGNWGKQQGSSCNVSLTPSHSGKYWCESGSGEHSNAVNITVHAGAVILESPALPVTEGDSVTLRCRHQGTPSDLTAVFYKDGSLIRAESSGEMTIPAVSKSDEGFYKCSSSKGESPESWILSPDAGPSPIPSPVVPVLSMSLPRLLCSLLVGSPYLLVGSPYLLVGSPYLLVGSLYLLVGSPYLLVGSLYLLVGSPYLLVGSPYLLVGSPYLLVGSPYLLVGSLYLLVGSPYLLVGSPYLLVGSPYLLVGSLYLLVGSPYLLVGSLYLLVGSPYLLVGSLYLLVGSPYLLVGSLYLLVGSL